MTNLEKKIKKIITENISRCTYIGEMVADVAKLVEQEQGKAVMKFWSGVCVVMYQRLPKEKAEEIEQVIQKEWTSSGNRRRNKNGT